MLAFCLYAALAAAHPGPATAQPSAPAEADARKDQRRQFDAQLQKERGDFHRDQSAERKAFRDGLRGKPAGERKARLSEFNARQKEKLKAFRETQRARRREFEEGLKKEP